MSCHACHIVVLIRNVCRDAQNFDDPGTNPIPEIFLAKVNELKIVARNFAGQI